MVGTVHYMVPEQAEGREVDGQSDVFSLGANLYEMVTGQRAFAGKMPLSVISAILEKEPTPIRSIKPATLPALTHLIDACLAKDRKNRWQTAHDVALELRWIARGDVSTGARAQQARDARVRERLAWLLAAAFTVLCLALAFGFLARSPRPMRQVRSSVLPLPGLRFCPTTSSFHRTVASWHSWRSVPKERPLFGCARFPRRVRSNSPVRKAQTILSGRPTVCTSDSSQKAG